MRRLVGSRARCLVALLPLAACTPALNWRDVRPLDSQALIQFPCRPSLQQRRLALAGAPVDMSLSTCGAGGLTWALAAANVDDAARVGPALRELAAAAVANVGSTPAVMLPLQVAGASSQPASGRLRLQGRLPDGEPVQMTVALFARGTRVYQASVLGRQMDDDAVDVFMSSIRLGP